jgi:hypothetical protein
MPNWYSGTLTIRGDIERFREWYKKNKDSENGLDNSFAQAFAPLSSGNWDYATACEEWGVKWDLGNISMISGEDDEDEEFSFSFDTAWNAPVYLWRQLELRYGVEVEEIGYEEQQVEFYKYHKGRFICKEIDNDWFAETLNFMPSDEALNNEAVIEDEKNEFKYDNWCDGMEKWNTNLQDDDPTWKYIEMRVADEE